MPHFLSLEEVLLIHSDQVGLYDLTLSVATGQTGKREIAEFFRKYAH